MCNILKYILFAILCLCNVKAQAGNALWDVILVDVSAGMSQYQDNGVTFAHLAVEALQALSNFVPDDSRVILFAQGRRSTSLQKIVGSDEPLLQFDIDEVGDRSALYEAIVSCGNLSGDNGSPVNVLVITSGADDCSHINCVTATDMVKATNVRCDVIITAFDEDITPRMSRRMRVSPPMTPSYETVNPDNLCRLSGESGGATVTITPSTDCETMIADWIGTLNRRKPGHKASSSKLPPDKVKWLLRKFPMRKQQNGSREFHEVI